MKLNETDQELKFNPIEKKNQTRYNQNTVGTARKVKKSKAAGIKLLASVAAILALASASKAYNDVKTEIASERGITYVTDYSTGQSLPVGGEDITMKEVLIRMLEDDKKVEISVEDEISMGK